MSEKAVNLKLKDLDPKAGAQNVKGGCLWHVDVDQAVEYAIAEGKREVRNLLKPR